MIWKTWDNSISLELTWRLCLYYISSCGLWSEVDRFHLEVQFLLYIYGYVCRYNIITVTEVKWSHSHVSWCTFILFTLRKAIERWRWPICMCKIIWLGCLQQCMSFVGKCNIRERYDWLPRCPLPRHYGTMHHHDTTTDHRTIMVICTRQIIQQERN